MLREKRIEVIKAFIENPNAITAMRMVYSREEDLNMALPCEDADDWNRRCDECVWGSVCHSYRGSGDFKTIPDEEMSAMVLDAMKLLAMYEAKNA
jgi:hypothetical protein